MYGEQLDENEQFLRDYVLNALWKSPATATGTGGASDDDDEGGDGINIVGLGNSTIDARAAAARAAAADGGEEDDDNFSDRADDFERRHNFRYEEEGAATLTGHPRHNSASVRRQAQLSRGKEKEEARKVRKAEARAQKEAELKRLKNLKKLEIFDRLRAIEKVSGGAAALTEVDLSGDFDPEEWDKRMAEVFNDDYYGANDAEWRVGDEDYEGYEGYEGDADAALERDLALAGASGTQWQSGGGGSSAGGRRDGFEALTSRLKASTDKKAKLSAQQYMDEYYALDYEDLLGGDLPTRFKYAPVAATGYGITDEEMLLESEKTLSKRVPLRFVKRPYAQLDESKLKGRANRQRWEERQAERATTAARQANVSDGQPRKRKRPTPTEQGAADDGAAGALPSEPPARKKKHKQNHAASAEADGAPSSSTGGGGVASTMSKAMSKAIKKGVGTARLEAFAKLMGKKVKKKNKVPAP